MKASNGEIRIGTYYETDEEQALFKNIDWYKPLFLTNNIRKRTTLYAYVIEEDEGWSGRHEKGVTQRTFFSSAHTFVVLKNCFSIDGQMITKLNN